METLWNTALWRQFGAAIDMLETALVACPASLWKERLWSDPPDPSHRFRGVLVYRLSYTLLARPISL